MINPFTHRKILRKGLPAEATVVRMSPLPPRGQHSARVNLAMRLLVRLEGREPYEVDDQWLVNPRDANCLTVGPIPVKVHRANSEKVAIDWPGARARYERIAESSAMPWRAGGKEKPDA